MAEAMKTEPVSYVAGCGAALPDKTVTNAEIARQVDTSDEWIIQRTGIRSRQIAGAGETTSTLALEAGRKALARAQLKPAQLDCIITATTSADHTFPAVAVQVQAGLGMVHGFAFDVQAACSGFLYGMSNAEALIRAGQIDNCLVIGADTLSRLVDWQDRGTCILFGDGAGACVLRAHPSGPGRDGPAIAKNGAKRRGILATCLRSDGRYQDILFTDGGPSTSEKVGKMRMKGREVFRHGVTNIAAAAQAVIEQAQLTADDIDWFVPHQANQRIIDAVARKMGLPEAKIISTVAEHANTSAASIPLALAQGEASGRIKQGDLIVMGAMGGGLTWGAMLLRW